MRDGPAPAPLEAREIKAVLDRRRRMAATRRSQMRHGGHRRQAPDISSAVLLCGVCEGELRAGDRYAAAGSASQGRRRYYHARCWAAAPRHVHDGWINRPTTTARVWGRHEHSTLE